MEVTNENIEFCNYPINQLQFDQTLGFVENLIIRTIPNENYEVFQSQVTEPIDQSCIILESNEVPSETPMENTFNGLVSQNEIQTNELAIERKKTEIQSLGPIKCPVCDKIFSKVTQYRIHLRKHHGKKRFQCSLCRDCFNQEVNFKIHMKLHEEGAPECPLCGRKFQRMASLKAHLLLHRIDETIICFYCHSEFEREEDFNKHLESHEGEQMESLNNELPLKCDHCNYLFGDVNKYKEHLLLHVKAKKFINVKNRFRNIRTIRGHKHKCDYCDKTFPKRCLLLRHKRIHTGEKPFSCDICQRRFAQKGTLQIHLNKHNNEKPYACMFCPAMFVQKGNLRAHLLKTHMESKPGEKLYKCTQCTCVFKKISTLNGHITRIHSTSPQETQDVNINNVITQLKQLEKSDNQKTDKQFLNSVENDNNLSQIFHVIIADGSVGDNIKRYKIRQTVIGENKWYLCNFCSKGFKKPSDLIRHIRIHTKEKPYKCSDCGATFAQKSTLSSHLATHQRNEFDCVICNNKFTSIRTLNVHLKKHDTSAMATKEYNYKCSHCDKLFNSLEIATRHLKIHDVPEDTIDYQSIESNSTLHIPIMDPLVRTNEGLVSLSSLKSNVSLEHEDDVENRPFRCHLCPSTFKKGNSLKRHMLVHSGVKKYTCALCEKSFSTQYALNDHNNYHTKTKKYKCSTCEKEFYTLGSLYRHESVHLTGRDYLCPYCNKSFRTEELCKKHIARHNISRTESLLNLPELDVIPNDDEKDASENVARKSSMDHSLLEEGNQQMYFTLDDLQIQLQSQSDVNELLPQLKQSEGSLLNNSQEQFVLYPIDTINQNFTTEQIVNYEAIATNIFNNGLADITLIPVKQKQTEADDSEENAINATHNLVATADRSMDILDYYNLNLSDYNEVAPLSAPLPELETKNGDCNNKLKDTSVSEIVEENVIASKQITSRERNEEAVDCPVCTRKFSNKTALLRHISVKHKDMVDNSCQFCRKTFKKKSDLDRHIRTHTGEKPFGCTKCDRSFTLKSTLISHLRTHNPTVTKDFKCHVCNAFFCSKSSLKTHTLIHSDKKPFACEICSKTFRNFHHKKSHMLSHENKNKVQEIDKPINVNLLEEMLLGESDKLDSIDQPITIHIENQHQEECGGEDFMVNLPIDNDTLEMSDRIPIEPLLLQLNSDFKPDESAEITMYNNEQEHSGVQEMLSHVYKEKKFQCDVCLKFYVSKSVLNKHKKALHGDYKCDKCSKAYNSEELLAKHYSSHEGIRPISCLYCNNAFATEANLKVHIKRMHKDHFLHID